MYQVCRPRGSGGAQGRIDREGLDSNGPAVVLTRPKLRLDNLKEQTARRNS